MHNVITCGLFWFFFGICFALMEIEIEGPYGWAEKTQTWYRTSGRVIRLLNFYLQGRPLTGYHCFLNTIFILSFHAEFVMGTRWTLVRELQTAAIFFGWLPVQDFSWFCLNPHFGVAKFQKESVWWFQHSKWIGKRMPNDYLNSTIVSLTLAAIASAIDHSLRAFKNNSVILAIFAAGLGLIVAVAPAYHHWRHRMATRDDRNLANIYHR